MKQTLKKDARIVDICPGLQLCPLCSIAATNRVLDALVAAHEGTIFSICVLKDGTLLTGGKDRKIIHWGEGYKKMGLDQEVSGYNQMSPV